MMYIRFIMTSETGQSYTRWKTERRAHQQKFKWRYWSTLRWRPEWVKTNNPLEPYQVWRDRMDLMRGRP